MTLSARRNAGRVVLQLRPAQVAKIATIDAGVALRVGRVAPRHIRCTERSVGFHPCPETLRLGGKP